LKAIVPMENNLRICTNLWDVLAVLSRTLGTYSMYT
jgi:hypothetical protein